YYGAMALRIPMLRAPTLRMALPSIARDPGSASLRRGLRAAVVVPLLLGAATLLAVQQSVATFLVFGVMALLVFADFGGQTRSRVSAYFLAALAGVPLIVVGTLASAACGSPSARPRWLGSCCLVLGYSAGTS